MVKPCQALATDYDGLRQYSDGCLSLLNNTIGFDNIALAINAGASLTTGNYNIDIGHAPKDQSNRRSHLPDDTAWEIHPVMALRVDQ